MPRRLLKIGDPVVLVWTGRQRLHKHFVDRVEGRIEMIRWKDGMVEYRIEVTRSYLQNMPAGKIIAVPADRYRGKWRGSPLAPRDPSAWAAMY